MPNPEKQDPVFRLTPLPANTNSGGDVFGGWLMSQVDLAGTIVANRIAEGRFVTVAVHSFTFEQPVYVGDVVSIYGDIERVGTSSVTVSMKVYAERRWPSKCPGENVLVCQAKLTYVAIDQQRRPRAIKSTD